MKGYVAASVSLVLLVVFLSLDEDMQFIVGGWIVVIVLAGLLCWLVETLFDDRRGNR